MCIVDVYRIFNGETLMEDHELQGGAGCRTQRQVVRFGNHRVWNPGWLPWTHLPCEEWGQNVDFHGNSQHFLWKIDTSLQALNFTLDGQNIFVTSLDLDRHDRRMERTHISKRDAEAGSPRCQPCHVYWTEGLELNLPITVTQKSLALASCPSQKSNIKHKTWVWTLENPLLKLSC